MAEIIKEENPQALTDFTNWIGSYLKGEPGETGIIERIEDVTEVKAMFATKLKEYATEFRKEGIEEGLEKGVQKKALEDAKRMLELNADVDFIQKVTELSKEDIEALRSET